ncbi:patched domain-containing protein 3 isoform X2 [Lepeophtheirus salmonis]|uniref:patched domain-containing protein 3 isoform X2 n=1 Tax=Lepeophtheirus salmonis TaxID=72036 RepID=UPI001AE2F915|nr:patched domain-containing protein 3-like isoform X2 [Lepeophtheirus salmonis]
MGHQHCMRKNILLDSLKKAFYRWGIFISRYPLFVIFSVLIIALLSSIGFLRLSFEYKMEKLWIPQNSEFISNKKWIEENFPTNYRVQIISLLSLSGNILTPEALLLLLDIHEKVEQISAGHNTRWKDLCFKVPVANVFLERNKVLTNDKNTTFDRVDDLFISDDNVVPQNEKTEIDYDDAFLEYENESKNGSRSLLEIWKFDRRRIKRLTKDRIVQAINRIQNSPVYGYKTNYDNYMGSIIRNETGHVVSASTLNSVWFTQVNLENVSEVIGLTDEFVNKESLEWELKFVDIFLNASTENISAFGVSARSFNDITKKSIFFDGIRLTGGFFIMCIYTVIMLGRLNCVEVRFFATIAGLFSILLGMVVSLGIISAMGLKYSPVFAMLPFLYLGIGIDDMFIIVQCWYNILEQNKKECSTDQSIKTLEEMMAETMKDAGVTITITSLTDIFAFGIGGITILPGLRHFSITCAIGIAAVFLCQISWFSAWFYLDQKRILNNKSGFFPCCIQYEDTSERENGKCFEFSFGNKLIRAFSRTIMHRTFQVIVIIISLILFSFGVWGAFSIRQEFDIKKFMPSSSYFVQWFEIKEKHSVSKGWQSNIYLGRIDPPLDIPKLNSVDEFLQDLLDSKDYIITKEVWWTDFKLYILRDKNVSHWRSTLFKNDSFLFRVHLSDFLYSSIGAQYKVNFRFDTPLRCNQPAPNINAMELSIDFKKFSSLQDHVKARKTIDNAIKAANFSTVSFSHSKIYSIWETEEIIVFELWRNMGIACIVVFVILSLFLANLLVSFLVLCNVIITVVDIVGFLHFWGITIDTIACVNIVLSIGLCVDYSIHIAHFFLCASGDAAERAASSVESIGIAIINGGTTTFMALILLIFSESHIFITFFKVFFLTVVFGLFHGMVLLPIILSLLGCCSKIVMRENLESLELSKISNATTSTEERNNEQYTYT